MLVRSAVCVCMRVCVWCVCVCVWCVCVCVCVVSVLGGRVRFSSASPICMKRRPRWAESWWLTHAHLRVCGLNKTKQKSCCPTTLFCGAAEVKEKGKHRVLPAAPRSSSTSGRDVFIHKIKNGICLLGLGDMANNYIKIKTFLSDDINNHHDKCHIIILFKFKDLCSWKSRERQTLDKLQNVL